MFEERIGGRLAPGYDPEAGRSVIDRLNMGRLYIFNLFGCVGVLLLTALFKLFKVHILPAGYQNKAFLLFSATLGLCGFTVFVISRLKRTDLFRITMLSYLGVVSLILYNFAFKAANSAVSLAFYCAIMMIIGCLPILDMETFAAAWVIDVLPMAILAWRRGFTADAVTSIITVSVMGFVLSVATYSNTIRKLNYKLSLDSALSEAETDPMTQLLNRRGFDRRLENIWPHCIRQNSHVAVLMIDIDNFKKYNDQFGHAAGDECIRKVTGAIKKNVKRRTDYAARVGGEEFLVMLTGIEPKLAVGWALNLKKSIDALKIPHADTNFNPFVTVSMGIACATVDDSTSFEKLREEADKSLYEAKYNGRACLYYHHKAFGRVSAFKKAGNE